jgi:hypothetical protein
MLIPAHFPLLTVRKLLPQQELPNAHLVKNL